MGTRFFDRHWYVDPHPTFAHLRATEPVAKDADTNTYALMLHEDVIWAERQPNLFSNAQGSRPNGGPQPSMIDNDDPAHSSQRRLVAKGFTPKQMSRYETHVQEVTTRLVDGALAKGTFDVVADLARPLPRRL